MPVADRLSWAREATAAVAFLTRIPVGRLVAFDGRDVARGTPFYPFVGAAVGALVGLTAHELQRPLTPALAAGLALVVGAVLTGALHLDAIADCADALGASSRERALEIMRDHTIGAYGATALLLDLFIKGAAVAALVRSGHVVAVTAAAGAAARAAPVLLAHALPYARAQGTAAAISEHGTGRRAAAAAAFAIALAVAMLAHVGVAVVLLVLGVAGLVTVLAGLSWWHWLGGVTGDTLGATTELVETAVLVVAVALV